MSDHDPYQPPKSAQQEEKIVVPKRPSFVTLGIVLIMVTSVTGLLTALFSMDMMLEQVMQENSTMGHDDTMIGVMKGGMIGGAIFGVLINALFCWFIAKGKNWARIVMLVLIAFGLLFSLPGLPGLFKISVPLALWSCLQNLVTLGALVCLFMPISNLWFKANK